MKFADLAGVTPMEKVITLLEDLKAQVQDEGAADAAAYKDLACFCEKNQVEKDEEIKKNEENINRLESELVELTATMEELSATYKDLACFCETNQVEKDEEIKKNEENINRLESELVELTATMEELSASIKELTEKIGVAEAELKEMT